MPVSVEQLLISSILRERDFKVALTHGLSGNMFHAYPEEWAWLEDYYLRHRRTPTKVAFHHAFPEFRVKASNDTGHFSDEVMKAHARHELTGTMRDAAEFIANGDLDSAIQHMQTSVVSIASGMGIHNDGDILRDYDDIVVDLDNRRQRYEDTGSAGIPTGFETLDERTGGPQPGELWIIGARLGEGKSYTMQKMACSALVNGYAVQFDALEQSRAQVAMRIWSMLASSIGKGQYDSAALMQGRDYDPKKFKRFLKDLRTDVAGALNVSDTSRGRVSSTTIAAQIERNNPDIVFVDYLTLMAKKSAEWQGVAELSSDLLQTANEYLIPLVAASQLNREHGLGKEPAGPEAIAQSDAIGQDATAVITLKPMSESVLVMKLAKYRNGTSGFKWYTHYNPKAGVFKEVTYDEALDLQDKDELARERSRRKKRSLT